MGMNASLADVARQAGVSQQTVSRVANATGQVSLATRAKVMAAMRSVGYKPNYAAKALRRGTFKALGLAVFDLTATGNISLLDGVAQAARNHGIGVTVSILGGKQRTLAAVERSMAGLPVDGIIVLMERMLTDLSTFSPLFKIPMTILTSAPVRACSTLDADQQQGIRLAVDYLRAAGHRHIAFVPGPENSVASQYRLHSFEEHMKKNGLQPIVTGHGDWTADAGYQIGLHLAPKIRKGLVTAVLAGNDNMANGLWQAFADGGLSIPQDVSLIGVDNSLQEVVPRLRLDSLDQHFIDIGREAVNMTLNAERSRQHGETPKPEHKLVPMSLVHRGSVGPARFH